MYGIYVDFASWLRNESKWSKSIQVGALCKRIDIFVILLQFFHEPSSVIKYLDAGIQDVSTSISIVHDLIERYPDGDDDDGDESDKHK